MVYLASIHASFREMRQCFNRADDTNSMLILSFAIWRKTYLDVTITVKQQFI